MIGKVTIGISFGGCVHYVMEKDKAELLQGYGVRSKNAEITSDDSESLKRYDEEWRVDSVREVRVRWVKERDRL